jgi:hypothetical protein
MVIHGHTSGMKKSPTYWSWLGMIGRCRYARHIHFSRYGGRGVKVCERWLTFENFLADMGERPEGLTLDRLDNAKDYAPSNCRWATRKEQARQNQRTEEFNGRTMTLAEIAAETGLALNTVYWRRARGLNLGPRLRRPKENRLEA